MLESRTPLPLCPCGGDGGGVRGWGVAVLCLVCVVCVLYVHVCVCMLCVCVWGGVHVCVHVCCVFVCMDVSINSSCQEVWYSELLCAI